MDMNTLILATTLMALVICLYESLTACKKTPINVAAKDLWIGYNKLDRIYTVM